MLRRNRDFVHAHFAATSPGIPFEKRFLRRPSRSSFPFFSVGHLPRRAFLLLSLSLSLFLNFLSLRSILTLLQRRRVISFLFLVLAVRRSRCHPPRPPREEKKRVWNPAGIVNAPSTHSLARFLAPLPC